jgi:mandelamide amidase
MALTQMGVVALCRALSDERLRAIDLARETIDRIIGLRALNCLTALDGHHLEMESFAVDRQRSERRQVFPLAGIPILLKDNIDTRHLPTSAGTPALANHRPLTDAPVVARLKAAGAILPAKAGMHELAFGITSNNAYTGPVRNPYDPLMIAGGSSGGCAAAVAARMFPAAIGTDTGASIRLPASLCGIYGFRPSVGRYPGQGIVPISRTRDVPGILARDLDDIRLIDELLAGSGASGPLRERPRLGVPRASYWTDLDAGVAEQAEAVLSALDQAGFDCIDVDLAPILAMNDEASFPIALFEVMRDLPIYLQQSGSPIGLDTLLAGVRSPDVAAIFGGLRESPVPIAVYGRATRTLRPAMIATYRALFRHHDLDALIYPASPATARSIGEDETILLNGRHVPTFPTYTRNLDLCSVIGAPGLSMPAGLSGGLPVGLEIDGLPGQDRALLALAARIAPMLPSTPAPI